MIDKLKEELSKITTLNDFNQLKVTYLGKKGLINAKMS